MSEERVSPFRFELHGARFNGARLPVDALVELERYQRLVRDVAVRMWKESYPGRRVPRALRDSFHLSLKKIEDGSAVPVFERQEADTEFEEWYARAGLQIAEGFASLLAGQPGTSAAQAVLGSAPARKFGASLLAEEAIEFHPREDRVIRATKERLDAVLPRRQLRLPPQTTHIDQPGVAAGRLVALDADNQTFRMRLLHGEDVVGDYAESRLTADMRRVLDSSVAAPVVRVEGLLRNEIHGPLLKVVNAVKIELLEVDGQPWSRRLIELASLPDGWEEGARRVEFAALDAGTQVLLRFQQEGRPLPGMGPLEDGGVVLEWGSPERVVNVEISPDLEFSLFRIDADTEGALTAETSNLSEALVFLLQEAP